MKTLLSGLMVWALSWGAAQAQPLDNLCPSGSGTTYPAEGSVTFWQATSGANNFGVGEEVTLSGTYTSTPGQAVTTTTNLTCDVTTTTNSVNLAPPSAWWEAQVGSYSASGSGFDTSFAPTNVGTGSVTFHLTYTGASGALLSNSVTKPIAVWANTDSAYYGLTDAQMARDGINPSNPTNVTGLCLGYWPFDDTNWAGTFGQVPISRTNLQSIPGHNLGAVEINNPGPAKLTYREIETNSWANINCRQGTLRFWFRPGWASTDQGGLGPQTNGRFIELGDEPTGSPTGWWTLLVDPTGTQVRFITQTNGSGATNLTAAISWNSAEWHQVALTYSPTNSSLYIDGKPVVTNGLGVTSYPGPAVRADGIRVGSDRNGAHQARGRFDDLETFNYAQSAQVITNVYATSVSLGRTNANTCVLRPITIPYSVVSTAAVYSTFTVERGTGPGNFSWLKGSDQNNPTKTLASELTNATGFAYSRPDYGAIRVVSIGSWIPGLTGKKNAKGVRESLSWLITHQVPIVLPVWGRDNGRPGANLEYQVTNYAQVILRAADKVDPDDINDDKNPPTFRFEYRGTGSCNTISNTPPRVNAGTNQTVCMASTVQLYGRVIDDGLPAGSQLTFLWSKVSGPGSVSFLNGTSTKTNATASFDTPGDYRLQLRASDSQLATTDTVDITVVAAPTVSGPANQTVSPGATATFTVTASGSGLYYQWELSTDSGANWGTISGASASSYTTGPVTTQDSGRQYRCSIQRPPCNPATSIAATLTVSPVANHPPELDLISNITIMQDAGPQIVNLTGISAGPGESQELTLTAVSANPGLIPTPTITYVSPNTTGSLTFSPAPGQTGSSQITVRVTDSGGAFIERPFTITVVPCPLQAIAGPDQTLLFPATATLGGSARCGTPPYNPVTWSESSGPWSTPIGANLAAGAVYDGQQQHTVSLTIGDPYIIIFGDNEDGNPVNGPGNIQNPGSGGRVCFTAQTVGLVLLGSASSAPVTAQVYARNGAHLTDGATAFDKTVSFDAPGFYQLTLNVRDNAGAVSSDTLLVHVLPNQPPVVEAGPDRTIPPAVGAVALLSGSVTDDGLTPLTVTWLKDINNPSANVTLSHDPAYPNDTPANKAKYKATFIDDPVVPGVYRFKLQANDGSGPVEDDMRVTVVAGSSRTFTRNVDFEQGSLLNVNYTAVPDQLQLNRKITPYPYVNMACSDRGTVARIDANNGNIVGEYFTSPGGGNPSRTTVDLSGNVWVGNRNLQSVARIGLIIGGTRGDKVPDDGTKPFVFVPNPKGKYLAPPYKYSTCKDKDGDGLICSSRGLGDIRPWGAEFSTDEAVDYFQMTGTAIRTIAIAKNNRIWTGGTDGRFEELDPTTGQHPEQFTLASDGAYGGLIDHNGILWSLTYSHNGLVRYNTGASVPIPPTILTAPKTYGIGIDPLTGNIWYSTYEGDDKVHVVSSNGQEIGAYSQGTVSRASDGRGLAVDDSGNVWVAQNTASIGHLRTDGTFVGNIALPCGKQACGVAIDCNGKVWVSDQGKHKAYRIDPRGGPIAGGGHRLGFVDLIVDLGQGANPYNYSDMTGFVSLGSTAPSGAWTVVHDGTAVFDAEPDQDADGDTDTNLEEFNANTCPVSDADADGDHVPDSIELLLGTSTSSSVDSDLDGMPDDFETWIKAMAAAAGNPLADVLPGEDFDGDGNSNLAEFTANTWPVSDADADSDHVPDTIEILLGTMTGAAGNVDSDGDGMPNDFETWIIATQVRGIAWGRVSWKAQVNSGENESVTIAARAADTVAGLANLPFVPIDGGATPGADGRYGGNCGRTGRYIEMQVRLYRGDSELGPVLEDLTVTPLGADEIVTENLRSVAVDDAFTVFQNSVENELDVLDNDHRAGVLSISGFGSAHNGSLALAGGKLLYTPQNGFYGNDSFTYRVKDDQGADEYGLATVKVTRLDPTVWPPKANDDGPVKVAGSINALPSGTLIDVLANDQSFQPPLGDDADSDGVPDLVESIVGITQSPADTDDDGLPDNWEQWVKAIADSVVNDITPDGDLDHDGLSNLAEFTNNTLPVTAEDRDGDKVPDYIENIIGTTASSNQDSDNDGMSDDWERWIYVASDYTVTDVTPDGDLDSDGQSNLAEYQAGTWPLPIVDTDGDHVPDHIENYITGTNPNDSSPADTDNGGSGDGMFDDWEAWIMLIVNDPLDDVLPNEDLDGDGISNLKEFTNRTRPIEILDGDNDGVPDYLEQYIGGTPGSAADTGDTGGPDGLPDDFERLIIAADAYLHPGNPTITTLDKVHPNEDFDGDGVTNLAEFNRHSSPVSPPQVEDLKTIVSVGNPLHGRARITTDCPPKIEYTPVKNYQGGDEFTYTIVNSKGLSDTATVKVTVVTPTEIGTADCGRTVDGTLDPMNDPLLIPPSNSGHDSGHVPYADFYEFYKPAGKKVLVTMTPAADSWNTKFFVRSPLSSAQVAESNKNGNNSSLLLAENEAGVYTIEATAVGTETTPGAYQLKFHCPGVLEIRFGSEILTLADGNIDLGVFMAGSDLYSAEVTLNNVGESPITIESWGLNDTGNDPDGMFTIGDPSDLTINPGGSATVSVSFDPTAVATYVSRGLDDGVYYTDGATLDHHPILFGFEAAVVDSAMIEVIHPKDQNPDPKDAIPPFSQYTLAARVVPPVGKSVTKVQFFKWVDPDWVQLGNDVVNPDAQDPRLYTLTYGDFAYGGYAIMAKATFSDASAADSVQKQKGLIVQDTVSIVSPTAGAGFEADSDITLVAEATKGDGATIDKLEFYDVTTPASPQLIGEATFNAGRYSYAWQDVPAGSYTVKAVASYYKTSDSQVTWERESETLLQVNLLKISGASISIIAPETGDKFEPPASVTVQAEVSAGTGQIEEVRFYNIQTDPEELLGTIDDINHYKNIWNGAALGKHTLTARMTLSNSDIIESDPSTVFIGNSVAVSSGGNYRFDPGSTIALNAEFRLALGQDVEKAEFYYYDGTTWQLIGTDSDGSGGYGYDYNWTPATAGKLQVRVKGYFFEVATLANTSTLESDPITIFVGNSVRMDGYDVLRDKLFPSWSALSEDITLQAEVVLYNGSVVSIVFREGATPIATAQYNVNSGMYEAAWSGPADGKHRIKAYATFTTGDPLESDEISIFIGDRVKLETTRPPDGEPVLMPSHPIHLDTMADAGIGKTVASVEFYDGANLLMAGEAPGPVFSWTHAPLPEGIYSYVAEADIRSKVDFQSFTVSSASVGIQVTPVVGGNQPPVAVEDEVSVGRTESAGVLIPVLANDYDPDAAQGDTTPVTIFSFQESGIHGNVTREGNQLRYAPRGNSYGIDSFRYMIEDKKGAVAEAWVIVHVAGQLPPIVSISAPTDGQVFTYDPQNPTANENITITATATGRDGLTVTKVDFYDYAKNVGTVTGNTTPHSFVWAHVPAGDHQFVAVATDSAGNLGYSQVINITKEKRSGNKEPVARISNLNLVQRPVLDGKPPVDPAAQFTPRVIEGYYEVEGVAADDDSDAPMNPDTVYYQFALRKPDGTFVGYVTPEITGSVGTPPDAPEDASFGVLDFIRFEDGVYYLELRVWDGWDTTVAQAQIILRNRLQLGRLTFSQEDVAIPAGDLPLSVIRTYDSFNPNTADFGYSWTYSLTDLKVEIDEARADVVDFLDDEVFSLRVGGGRNVTLTLPGGRRTTFTYRLKPVPSGEVAGLAYAGVWDAEPGVTATLTSLSPGDDVDGEGGAGDNTIYAVPWPHFWRGGWFVGMENYDIPGFRLTLEDGTEYEITREDLGLHDIQTSDVYEDEDVGAFIGPHAYGKARVTRITRRNGESIHIRDDKIEHVSASGVATSAILFARDEGNRIKAIYDPASLGSDGKPNGPATVLYDYDEKGNLYRVHRFTKRDTSGDVPPNHIYETITYIYDTAPGRDHFIKEIQDPRGIKPIVNEYDDKGRLWKVTDADGFTTEFVHDNVALSGLSDQELDPAVGAEKIIDNWLNETIHEYDARGNVVVSINPVGLATVRVYDADNNRTTLEQQRAADAGNTLISETEYQYTYHDGAEKRKVATQTTIKKEVGATTAQSITTVSEFDEYGRLTGSIDAKGVYTRNEYDASGNLTSTAIYDSEATFLAQGDPLQTPIINEYHASDTFKGLLHRTKDAGDNYTYYEYYDGSEIPFKGAFGQVKTVTQYQGDNTGTLLSKVINTYDAMGNVLTVERAKNNVNDLVVTRNFYDAKNRLIKTIDPGDTRTGDAAGTKTIYNSIGKVETSIDRLGNPTHYLYNAKGEVIRTTYPDDSITLSATEYGYPDGSGQRRAVVTTQRHLPGDVVYGSRTVYDEAGRTVRTERLRNVVINIVPRGDAYASEFVSADDPESPNGPALSYTQTVYDETGRMERVFDSLANTTTEYGYDGYGRRETTTKWVTISAMVQDRTVTVAHYDGNGNVQDTDVTAAHFTRDSTPVQVPGTTTETLSTPSFKYDKLNRRWLTTYVHDEDGTPVTTHTRTIHDAVGRVEQEIDQEGVATKFEYDAAGRLTAVTKAFAIYNPADLDSEDGNGNPAPITPTDANPADKATTRYKYDLAGNLIRQTDANQTPLAEGVQKHTTFTYDGLGRRLTRTLPEGNLTETSHYNDLSQLEWHEDFKGQRTEFYYDSLGRLTHKFFFEDGAADPANSVEYRHDGLGRVTRIIERSGDKADGGYPTASLGPPGGGDGTGNGLLASLGQSLNKVPRGVAGGLAVIPLLGLACVLIPRRKLRELMLCLAAAWRAQLLSLSALGGEGRGEVLRFRKRLLPNYGWRFASVITVIALIGCDPAFDGLWTANASCNDLPSNPTIPDERVTILAYDHEGHLTQVNSPEGVINYEYDPVTGSRTRTCSKNSEIAYAYDLGRRLGTVTVNKRNNSTLVTPDVTTYSYTALGSRERVTLPNNTVTRYTYDDLNRLRDIEHRASNNTLLAGYHYELYPTGRRQSATEDLLNTDDSTYVASTFAWQYDNQYRLRYETCTSTGAGLPFSTEYQYDKVGNRKKKISGTKTIDYSYNDNDRLTSEVLSASGVPTETTDYGYDDNGSLTSKAVVGGATITYNYNLANKLKSVTGTGGTVNYLYNDSGIRVQSAVHGGSTTHYLIDANNHTGYAQVLEELATVGGTPAMSYVIGDDVLGQSTASTVSWLLYDGHGNARHLVKNTDDVTSQYNYDAYGLSLTTLPTDPEARTSLLYCGEQYDTDLEMYNLRARFYNPSNGRFNAMDSFAGSNFDPQSLHKYTYCQNDGVNRVDPSGFISYIESLVVMAIIAILFVELVVAVAHPVSRGRLLLGFYTHGYAGRKLVNHWLEGSGDPLELTEDDMVEIAVCSMATGGPPTITEGEHFSDYLRQLSSGSVYILDMPIYLGARQRATLGRFYAHVSGTLSGTPSNWAFDGEMWFIDRENFDQSENGTWYRNAVCWAIDHGFTGTDYDVTSELTRVTQTSSDAEMQWAGTGTWRRSSGNPERYNPTGD